LAAASVLKPGVMGWQVDEASRDFFIDNGMEEYKHAVGHHIGRSVHDGATVLGPRWERYGNTPEGIVEVGNIFTLELGVSVPGYGFIGLEEDVLVKENGLEWLSTPQEEIIVVG
jgi:Xaa-Pro aminopeptidase